MIDVRLISISTNDGVGEKPRNTSSHLHTDFKSMLILINIVLMTKRLYNISLLLIYHAAQSLMGRISGQSILIHQHSFTDDP